MTKNRLFSILSASTLILFALSALITVPALAAGSTPPAPASPTTQTNLKKLPKGTAVVAVDGTGTVQPLASQAAAKIIAKGDPIWCPTGQKPGGAGCTPPEATVTQLISDLTTKSGAGTVYFTSTYSANDATFDQTNANLVNLTDLTIQGGWNGKVGKSYKLAGVSTFINVPLSVTNWIGNVTINNVSISGASGNGLTVSTKGNIHVHDVQSNNNTADGASLDNCVQSGPSCTGSGSISVDTSTFNNNTVGDGLFADSNGAITLTKVTASANKWGAGLDNHKGTGVQSTSVQALSPATHRMAWMLPPAAPSHSTR